MQTKISPEKLRRARAYFERKANSTSVPNGRFLAVHERRLIKKLVRRWKVQQEWAVENMKTLSFFLTDETAKGVRRLEVKGIRDEIQAWLDGMVEVDRIAADVTATARATFKKGGKYAHETLNMGDYGVSFNLLNNDAVEYLDALTDLHLSNYRGSITYTTRKRLITILSEAATTGMSYQETAKLIRAQGDAGVFSQARGELIAVRETRAAYETGKRKMVDLFEKQTGTRSAKSWVTVGDANVTPECASNQAAGWIEKEATFPSGDLQPPRSKNPRCRCHVAWTVLEPTQLPSDLNGSEDDSGA